MIRRQTSRMEDEHVLSLLQMEWNKEKKDELVKYEYGLDYYYLATVL